MANNPARRQIVWMAASTLGLASAGAGWWLQQRRGAAPSPGLSAFWASEMKDLDGRTLRLDTLRGQPLVVNFWATWCGPCVEEMPDFQKASLSPTGKKARFVGIGIDYAAKMKPFATKLGISYLLLESGAQGLDLIRGLGNPSGVLPFTMILDSKGNPVNQVIGKMNANALQAALSAL